MALLTFFYVLFTIFIFWANYKSVNEMKLTREETTRPYVVVYIHTKQNGLSQLIIENIGATLAKEVKISISPEFNYPKNNPLSKTYILKDKISNIPPSYKMIPFAGPYLDFKKDNGEYEVFEVDVRYTDSKDKSYDDQYSLDLNVQSGISNIKENDIHDLTKEFSEFKKVFKSYSNK